MRSEAPRRTRNRRRHCIVRWPEFECPALWNRTTPVCQGIMAQRCGNKTTGHLIRCGHVRGPPGRNDGPGWRRSDPLFPALPQRWWCWRSQTAAMSQDRAGFPTHTLRMACRCPHKLSAKPRRQPGKPSRHRPQERRRSGQTSAARRTESGEQEFQKPGPAIRPGSAPNANSVIAGVRATLSDHRAPDSVITFRPIPAMKPSQAPFL